MFAFSFRGKFDRFQTCPQTPKGNESMHTRLNILWISFEDTSPRFGCYGDPIARTPNVDRLASEGCRYPNLFGTAPVCAPNRAAIITGLYPTSCGTHHMRTVGGTPLSDQFPGPYHTLVPHYVRCIPEYLRAAGYFCTNNVKTDYQFAPPVSAWDWCRKGAHWRDRPDPDQPFFCVFNLDQTHESGQWDPYDTDVLRAGVMEPKEQTETDPDAVVLPPYLPDTPEVRKALARQYDNIAHNDHIVGRLLKELEEDGLAEQTIVFIWSDHGEGLPRAKRWPYDAGVHVPLILRWPGQIAPGTVDRRMVSSIDLGPTVLALAGLDIPRHIQGVPFLGPQARERHYCFSARDRFGTAYDMVRTVRDPRYRYIRNFCPESPRMAWSDYRSRHPAEREIWKRYLHGTLQGHQHWFFNDPRPTEELYDCHHDPWQLHNLAHEPALNDTLERMRNALEDWRREVGDLGELDETVMKRWWYPDHERPTTDAPIIVPIHAENELMEPTEVGGRFTAPLRVLLHVPMQGASIVYTFDDFEDPHWLLYTGPIAMPPGQTTLRTKAIRIGYHESPERSLALEVV